MLLDSQQRELHHAVARAIEIEMDDAVELLAYHYSRATVPDKAMLYLDMAARKAQRDYANETALTYYRQALAWEERWPWRKGEIEVLHLLGRRDEERAALVALAALPDAPPFEVAYLWGQYYEALADYPQAQSAVEKALEYATTQQDSLGQAQSLSELGLIARRQGNYEQAQSRYMGVLSLFPAEEEYGVNEGKILISTLNGLGITLRQQGKFDQAQLYYNWGLTLCRTTNNMRTEAMILNSLGVNAFYRRNLAEARTYYEAALEIRRRIGDRAGVGISLTNLATAIRSAGDFDQAQPYYTEALFIQHALGNRWEEVNILNSMGVSFLELGIYFKSESYLKQGIALAREIGDEIGVAYLMDNLGLVAYESQDFTTAEQYQREGLEIARQHNESHLISNYLYHMSMTSVQSGDLEQAAQYAQASFNLRQTLDMRLSTTGNLAILGQIAARKKLFNQALDFVTQAYTILNECQGEGPEFPQLDYFICFQVFSATEQQPQAAAALRLAYDLVMARADKISESSLRQSFLENVVINRQIVATYCSQAALS
jgi:tetratricopeptide (TPR) repeat protein